MAGKSGAPGFSLPEDIALVLHTSGTTSRPKIVPLTAANICASARHIGATLRLAPADRCLNIMPLFHIHGLMAAVLASLAAGASVVCTPGFNALKFFAWLDEVEPTWYTAVPTMHQAILARAGRNPEIIARARLRFIRSSSSSLPPSVLTALEATFGCPVIEAYGMTEAAHQMASNPLPPAARKPGSVGIAAGPRISIMDENGNLLTTGSIGEVVIRGDNVTRGYANNAEANAAAFSEGWFRTGDQGVIDPEGYLTLTGRLKELINRGGEKISPREVDEALMDHPAVLQAVTFALPHPMLGEDVGAAVVLRYSLAFPDRVLGVVFTNSRAAFWVGGGPGEAGDGDRPQAARPQSGRPATPATTRDLPIHPINASRLPATLQGPLVAAADAVPLPVVGYYGRQLGGWSSVRELDQLAMPVLLVNGRWEKGFRPHVDEARAAIPHLEVVDLEGGHAINIEQPEGFDEAVLDFVARHSPAHPTSSAPGGRQP